MHKTSVYTLCAVALCLLWTSPVQAGAWTQAEGAYYAKTWTRLLVGSAAYFDDGEVRELGIDYSDVQLQFYSEAGLADGWTLVTALAPIGFASAEGKSAVYTGDLTIGVRRGILSGTVPVAIEAHYGFTPGVGEDPLISGVVEDRPFVYIPVVETHKADAELQVGYGGGWGWVTGSAGARYLSGKGLDPVIYGFAQVGTSTESGFVFDFHAALHEPLGDVEITSITGTGQTRYLGLGLGASWWFVPQWGINLGFDGVAYAASNAATPSITIGLEHRSAP